MASFPQSRSLPFSSSSSGGGERVKKRRRLIRACDRRDWSEGLPRDVLFCVLEKLTDAQDHVRFGAVCPYWRSVLLEEIEVPTRRRPSCCSAGPPFLLIPPPSEEEKEEGFDQQMALYSLSTGRVSDFRLQVPHRKVCRGSSLGWLVTLETKAMHDCRIQLLNPFLTRTINLPPIDSILQRHPEAQNPWKGYYLHKAVLSSDPLSSPDDFVLMSIVSTYFGLAFFRAGDTNWTTIRDDWDAHRSRWDFFQDVIFSRKTNQFYALTHRGEVVSIDLAGGDARNPRLTEFAPPVPGHFRQMGYLLEDLSSGHLLQVSKSFDTKCSMGVPSRSKNGKLKKTFHYTMIMKFFVFKLTTTDRDRNWIQIDDIGQNIIFVGNNCSMLRSASDCPGCQPNCIYYTDDADFINRSDFSHCGPHINGIYDIKKGVLRTHYSAKISPPQPCSELTSSTKILPQPIWLEPTLRCRN